MASVGDPVGSGLVASLAHPGGNVTGTSLMMTDLSAKRLQLLKETIPGISRVAVMLNPVNPWYKGVVEELKMAARSLSITLKFIDVQREEEIGPAFFAIRQARAQALFLIEDALLAAQRTKLLKLAWKAKLPVSSGTRDYVADGGLMSYSASFSWMFRRSAYYVDRILKGTKPADLPVEQPTKFEFVVNLKTAKALGITLPESILIRADEVIK
jgi:putative tryptophan/tyrosine transport system substrate-binding protein